MLVTGSILQGRYRIEELLGRGGMGAVYKAVDMRLGSTVALKETTVVDTQLRRAFEREARFLNTLRHAALPVVIDYFTDGGGEFLVMQYIGGPDLGALMESGRGPFAPADVLRWADQLLDVLEYLHGHTPPIVHRDIKPQNLKVSERGDIVLLDFGLAKGAAAEMSRVTGSVFGFTPHYAPFEQIQGKGTDPRSDLYSLAATLSHLLTGQKPPDALERCAALVGGLPDPLRSASELVPAVPAAVSAVLWQAMAQSPESRPPSAVVMRAMLRRATAAPGQHGTVVEMTPGLGRTKPELSPQTIPAQPLTSVPETHTAPTRRGWTRAAVVVAVSMTLVAIAASVGLGISQVTLNSVRASLAREQAERVVERRRLDELTSRFPVTLKSLKLRNEVGGKALGDFGTRFPRSEVRFINWYAEVENNASGIRPAKGKVRVKFWNPDGTLSRGNSSPVGASQEVAVEVIDTKTVNQGWGNSTSPSYDPGVYRIEIWWDDQVLLGQQTFTVVEDAPNMP